MFAPPDLWAIVVLAALLVAAAVADVRRGKIPNAITYPAMAVGLIGQTYLHGTPGLLLALGGLAAGFIPLLVAWVAGGIGGGDAKLMGAVGALTCWQFAVSAMFLAFAIAAFMAIFVMVKKRIVRRTLRRIAHSVLMALTPRIKGAAAESEPSDSPRIPFGVALCLGSAIALADVLLGGPIARALMGM